MEEEAIVLPAPELVAHVLLPILDAWAVEWPETWLLARVRLRRVSRAHAALDVAFRPGEVLEELCRSFLEVGHHVLYARVVGRLVAQLARAGWAHVCPIETVNLINGGYHPRENTYDTKLCVILRSREIFVGPVPPAPRGVERLYIHVQWRDDVVRILLKRYPQPPNGWTRWTTSGHSIKPGRDFALFLRALPLGYWNKGDDWSAEELLTIVAQHETPVRTGADF